MINLFRNSDKLIIIVHEIYGVNSHIFGVCNEFFNHEFDVICPNILERKDSFGYFEEKEEYENFIKNIGFIKMVEIIKTIFNENSFKYKKIFLLGFSVGATAAWILSSMLDFEKVICYYGSRIRDYLDIKPKCEILAFFSDKEQFDLYNLIEKMESINNVKLCILTGEHGFADPFSKQYNRNSAETSKSILFDFLSQ